MNLIFVSIKCCLLQIMKQIDAEGIQLYPLPECDEDEDEDYKEQCRQLKVVFKFCN